MVSIEEIEAFRKEMSVSSESRYLFKLWVFYMYHMAIYGKCDIYDYQKAYLRDENNRKILCCGRQVGKSVMNADECIECTYLNDHYEVIIASPSKPQTKEMFDRIKTMIACSPLLSEYIVVCNQAEIRFRNNSVIKCVTANPKAARGYTCNLLIMDEAAFIEEEVFQAIDATTLVREGGIRLLSTPNTKEGRFYQIWSNEDNDTVWSKYHVKTEDNLFISREKLAQMKLEKRSEADVMREFEGRFVDDDESALIAQADLIKSMTETNIHTVDHRKYEYYLAADIARKGKDKTAVVVFAVDKDTKRIEQKTEIKMVALSCESTVNSFKAVSNIMNYYNKFLPRKVYIDGNGAGAGVVDICERAINKRNIVVDLDLRGRTRVDAYMNTVDLIIEGNVTLINDKRIIDHYKNITKIKTTEGVYRIHKDDKGNDDIADAITFAVSGINNEYGRAISGIAYVKEVDFSQLWKNNYYNDRILM